MAQRCMLIRRHLYAELFLRFSRVLQRWLLQEMEDTSAAFVSPPLVKPRSEARWSGSQKRRSFSSPKLQDNFSLLSAEHRSKAAAAWNSGVDSVFGWLISEVGKRGF